MQKAHLGAATIGVGLIAMGEDLGTAMATRMLEHLLSYADPDVRAAVPLTLALLRPSEPEMTTMDTLSRLSHDMDNNVARGALLGLGILGAGTNNARLAGALHPLPFGRFWCVCVCVATKTWCPGRRHEQCAPRWCAPPFLAPKRFDQKQQLWIPDHPATHAHSLTTTAPARTMRASLVCEACICGTHTGALFISEIRRLRLWPFFWLLQPLCSYNFPRCPQPLCPLASFPNLCGYLGQPMCP